MHKSSIKVLTILHIKEQSYQTSRLLSPNTHQSVLFVPAAVAKSAHNDKARQAYAHGQRGNTPCQLLIHK